MKVNLLQLTLLLILLCTEAFAANCDQCPGIGSEKEVELIPANYSAMTPLLNVFITWNLHIRGILVLSPKDMDFSVDVELIVYWEDSQLQSMKLGDAVRILKSSITDEIYIPLLEFTNCNACGRLIIDPHLHTLYLFKKEKITLISYMFRKKISFNCIFDLSRYPFDVQICRIDVQRMVIVGEIKLSIENDKKFYETLDKKDIPMPSEFKLVKIEVNEVACTRPLNEDDIKYQIKYTCFSYKFTFERTILQNILLIFLPSTLIVMLSWISFWLDVDLAAPRVALGQTSLLTLAAQFNSVQNNLPPVSTVKALDVWMFICILMAFASILEYALAYNCRKRSASGKNKIGPYRKVKHLYEEERNGCIPSRSVDFWAKIIFPIIFLTFNILFWGALFFTDFFKT